MISQPADEWKIQRSVNALFASKQTEPQALAAKLSTTINHAASARGSS